MPETPYSQRIQELKGDLADSAIMLRRALQDMEIGYRRGQADERASQVAWAIGALDRGTEEVMAGPTPCTDEGFWQGVEWCRRMLAVDSQRPAVKPKEANDVN